MEQTILCLNGGSSSLKFAVYRVSGGAEERIFSGAVEGIGEDFIPDNADLSYVADAFEFTVHRKGPDGAG